ncbi:hypothetical protein ACJMK2_023245 [Sinanodonta woodiana]|uniref:C-type lectin domain-containing protein n=1 Tax=Sinanodonta woodiana TaxID=1069815 RepID=A0ABD3T3L6_SINWO
MGHLTRWYAMVILVCGTVAALDDPYIHLTKRLNNIERNVNANFEIIRTEMTVMFEIMNRINSSVFDRKEMFLNNMKHDANDKPTEPVSVNASTGSSMSSRLPSSELSLQTHLMSIRNGFGAEKRERIKLTNDVDRILLALKEYNSSVDAKLHNLERNLSDVVRTHAELKEENRITLTKMQEKLEAKQTSVEDTVRQLIGDASTKNRTCPAMFEKHGNSCYFAVPIEETWLNAKLICHLLDADLVKMEFALEGWVVHRLATELQLKGYPYIWIDGSDLLNEGTFQWFRNNGRPKEFRYPGWSIGEPNGNTTENCMMYSISHRFRGWNDYRCDNRIPFVCVKEL